MKLMNDKEPTWLSLVLLCVGAYSVIVAGDLVGWALIIIANQEMTNEV